MRRNPIPKFLCLSIIISTIISGGMAKNEYIFAPSLSRDNSEPQLAYVDWVSHNNSTRNHMRTYFFIVYAFSTSGGSKTEIHEFIDYENQHLTIQISRSIAGRLQAIDREEIKYGFKFQMVGEWTIEINNYDTSITVLDNSAFIIILSVLASSIVIGVVYTIFRRHKSKKRLQNWE